MRTDPEHIAYEAWIDQHPLGYPGIEYDAFVAGYRAALQSQDAEDAGQEYLKDGDVLSIMANFGEHHVENGHAQYDKWQALDAARAIEKAVILSGQVQAWKLDAERYQHLKNNHTSSNVKSNGKFGLPDLGQVLFEWRRREWKDGKPYVAMELDEAIDHARRIEEEA